MNALDLDRAALEFASGVCTAKQMEVLQLKAEGLGTRAIARRLMITPTSTKNRLDAAILHLQKAIIELEVQSTVTTTEGEADVDDDHRA